MTFDPKAHGLINPYALMRAVPSFTLTSTDIQHGEPLPKETYGAFDNASPQLSWADFPAETQSFAVTCYDPDAPTGSGFWHWAVANIPATTTSLPSGAGAPDSTLLPEGAITLPNEMREPAFTGAAPPEGTGVHHYWFAVHALSVPHIDIDPQATPAALGFTMRDVTLARAVIVATGEYQGD
ncbi:YbhB/YbcL family Raf kinase inhibitor-like protein [Leucobacter chinensis]|uniref:YbhB/YbcL family Raf kinase inhibitor-like protein n=1 Tax=Leucobacter chinensis TaxID=2851010 RepID=UPI001C21F684|nr:YbhB/YbcL family Raf kinase inhibitor-like protein [Leucobacter chinensis]